MIDRVGVLAGLYYYAHMTYIGGAFTSGVHNILEPASMKSKISFGPKYSNSTEAIEMHLGTKQWKLILINLQENMDLNQSMS